MPFAITELTRMREKTNSMSKNEAAISSLEDSNSLQFHPPFFQKSRHFNIIF